MPKTKDKFRTVASPSASTVIKKGSKYDKAYLKAKAKAKNAVRGTGSNSAENWTSRVAGAARAGAEATVNAKRSRKKKK